MASVEKTYEIRPFRQNTFFLFESVGKKGSIVKFVWFQNMGNHQFNLAFGDFDEGMLRDDSVTNNNDISSVISTVAVCVYKFVESYPGATILIFPLESKRTSLYNYIMRNRFQEISVQFEILGVLAKQPEKYEPSRRYDSFVLKHKIT